MPARKMKMRKLMNLRRKKNGRITTRTKYDFLRWLKKKRETEEQTIHAHAMATWSDDGGPAKAQAKPPGLERKE